MKPLAAVILLICFAVRFYPADFMNVSEIKSGMKGYGLSVFKGWESERFDVEIIDVVKNFEPKGDVILARLKGNGLEDSGVIAGMSGSPVYIDGKLIGAVAFAWAYAKEPLCGITPIGEMIREKDNINTDYKNPLSIKDNQLKNISTPLFINGFTGEVRDYIKNYFENKLPDASYLVMNGGGGSSEFLPNDGLKGGDAVAVNMMDGDYLAQGIGTVTFVSNNDVYIFGHPMDLAGNTELPISRSYIYSVIPSINISFKLGSSSKPVGAVVYDGKNGVYCRLKKEAAMIPVDVKIKNNGSEYKYSFRTVDNRNYFPTLASGAVSSSILNHSGYLDDKRINMNLIMNIEYQNKNYAVNNKFNYAFNPSYFDFGILF